ncbi:hypothetical protein Tco_0744128 [Tanacetum coccineum]
MVTSTHGMCVTKSTQDKPQRDFCSLLVRHRLGKKRIHCARGRCLVVTVALQRERTKAAAVELAPHTVRPYV